MTDPLEPTELETATWLVDGAPAPTLVLSSSRRVADPLAVLQTALDLSDLSIVKVALVHPPEEGSTEADAEYVFAQVVRGEEGPVLDLTAECGHSMMAAAAHLHDLGVGSSGAGRVVLQSRRSGTPRLFTCLVHAVTDGYLVDLDFPLRSEGSQFPLGREPVDAGAGIEATVVDDGNLYAFVDADQLGIDTPDELFAAGADARELLQGVRARLAPRLDVDGSQVLPKPALLLHGADGALHVRALSAADWHPGVALTGLVAVASLESAGPDAPAGPPAHLSVTHASGVEQVDVRATDDGAVVALTGTYVARAVRSP